MSDAQSRESNNGSGDGAALVVGTCATCERFTRFPPHQDPAKAWGFCGLVLPPWVTTNYAAFAPHGAPPNLVKALERATDVNHISNERWSCSFHVPMFNVDHELRRFAVEHELVEPALVPMEPVAKREYCSNCGMALDGRGGCGVCKPNKPYAVLSYDPEFAVPTEIFIAARQVSNFFREQHIREWKLAGCAGREWLERYVKTNEGDK